MIINIYNLFIKLSCVVLFKCQTKAFKNWDHTFSILFLLSRSKEDNSLREKNLPSALLPPSPTLLTDAGLRCTNATSH